MDREYTKAPRAAVNVNAEDVATIRRAVPVSPGVRWQRERENETAALAVQIDREHKRRKKGGGRAADEALARAEAIVAAAESKTRKVKTHTGREVPLSLLRETALKKLEIEFGADAPIHVECAYCHEVFFVKAGTQAKYMPTTCKLGCKCACGRRVYRGTAIRASKRGVAAHCIECRRDVIASAVRARTPEQNRAAAAKARASQTPEQRLSMAEKLRASQTPAQLSANSAKFMASLTPEQRRARMSKAAASITPEQRRKAWAARRAKGGVAADPFGHMTPEQQRARKLNAAKSAAEMTPEQRRLRSEKIWATRRANAAAKAAK